VDDHCDADPLPSVDELPGVTRGGWNGSLKVVVPVVVRGWVLVGVVVCFG
jgi:hypothetical protein